MYNGRTIDNDDPWGSLKAATKPIKPTKKRVSLIKAPPKRKAPLTFLHEKAYEPTVRPASASPSRDMRPEATLDLHGLQEAAAHDSLIAFIHNARHQGIRFILVITGKGEKMDTYNLYGGGVLRTALPKWLDAAPLKPFVISCTHAPAHLGGTGAFMVHLKRKERKK